MEPEIRRDWADALIRRAYFCAQCRSYARACRLTRIFPPALTRSESDLLNLLAIALEVVCQERRRQTMASADGDDPATLAVRVAGYIEQHLAQRITVKSLARELGSSSSHLERAFKVSFGVSVKQYVSRSRADVAKCLLTRTTHKTQTIASSLGIGRATLNRLIRLEYGSCPAGIRRAAKALASS